MYVACIYLPRYVCMYVACIYLPRYVCMYVCMYVGSLSIST